MVQREVGHLVLERETDCVLVGLAAAGDRAAFAVLVNRYRIVMGANAQSTLGSYADADDVVVQDVLINAWEKLSTVYDGSIIAIELVVPEPTVRGLLARSRNTLAHDLAAWR